MIYVHVVLCFNNNHNHTESKGLDLYFQLGTFISEMWLNYNQRMHGSQRRQCVKELTSINLGLLSFVNSIAIFGLVKKGFCNFKSLTIIVL